jgi:agmatine deiminase
MPPTSSESTPAADGFRMPAEWERHEATWMCWPERPDTWRLGAAPAQAAFAAVARVVAASERVRMGVSARELGAARAALEAGVAAGDAAVVEVVVEVVELASDDAWMRDIGPTFVVDDRGERRGVDWVFNAWGGHQGGLYPSWERDDRVAATVLEHEHASRYRAPIVLEGGAVHVDGQGTLLTTEECLLHPNRNPGWTPHELEAVLHDYLGVERVIWLGEGVVHDETDGHVDNLACFVEPGVIALTWTDDRSDPQYARSLDARQRLEAATDARGRSLDVRLVPMPGPLTMTLDEAAGVLASPGTKPRRAGDRLAASYVNWYVANDLVVVPRLDERHDDGVLELVGGWYPHRRVVGIDSREILLGGGNVHCITQQVPAG